MNTSKTEFIQFGSRQQLKKTFSESMEVVGDIVKKSHVIKLLGVKLDVSLTMREFILNQACAATANINRLRKIRSMLTVEACKICVCGLVTSILDYFNPVLYGVAQRDIKILQVAQNNAARLILNRDRRSSGTEILYELHWLPIQYRIKFKILVLAFKSLNQQGPVYLKKMLTSVTGSKYRTRAPMDTSRLVVPVTHRRTFADRSFSVAAPTLWNNLPMYIRNCDNLAAFKKCLKTFLFKEAFSTIINNFNVV